MRSYAEMMGLIMQTAQNDSRIRAVVLNGSRANPQAPVDCFQDYDILYAVRDIASFTDNHNWIYIFGDRIMLQMPEENRNPMRDGHFTYLMLFTDGNRLDLSLLPVEKFAELDERESASILLLDKDSMIKPYPPASDMDYHIKPPREKDYASCCNNFWWCSQNVAKGIWRDEWPYAMYMYDRVLRDELHDMIRWYIGVQAGFTVSAGKMGKYFKRYLTPAQYATYIKTYGPNDEGSLWKALFTMTCLFRDLALAVASSTGYPYPILDDEGMTQYLRHIQALPKGATEVF